jgi:hypothetical protein
LAISIAWIGLILTACGKESPPPSNSFAPQLSVTPAQVKTQPGNQVIFSAQSYRSQGEVQVQRNPHWSSSDSDIATASETGLVTARGEGSARIKASIGELNAEACLEVTEIVQRPVEIVQVMPTEDSIFFQVSKCNLPCLGPPSLGSIGADFDFPGEDTFKSARLFIDCIDVTSKTRTFAPMDQFEGEIIYNVDDASSLGSGLHQIRVEANSQKGKMVTYTWKFTLE